MVTVICFGVPNYRAALDAGRAICLNFVRHRPGASERHRSPIMRAERAELESRRDEMIIAQGKRGTSAALGCGSDLIPSFFPSGLARLRRAKPEGKKEGEWGGVLPRAAASRLRCATARQAAALPWAIITPPLRGSGEANQSVERTAEAGGVRSFCGYGCVAGYPRRRSPCRSAE